MRPWSVAVASALAACLALAACVAGDDEPSAPGAVVEIFGPFRDEEAELLAASLDAFEETSGITIRYTGTGSFVADLEAQVRAANPPDIAMVPQPGLVTELARSGDVLPLSDEVLDAVGANYREEIRQLAEVDGVVVGVPFRANAKSLVWYRPDVFEERGLTVPTTLADLDELVGQIEASGTSPWCLGLEAQGATGWVATDWTEEMVLRLAGPDLYDRWARGEVGFADPAVAGAFDAFRALVLTPGRVDGGISDVLRTPVRRSVLGLFGPTPDCVLHRQASFAFGWMPAGTEFGPDGDVDFFVLPGTEPGVEPPLLIGSTLAVAFDDRPEVAAVMAHLASPESTSIWEAAGGFISPRSTSALVGERAPVDEAVLDLLLGAETVRADASDAMPPAIGSGLLWSEITDWVANVVTYEQFATTIDEARAAVG